MSRIVLKNILNSYNLLLSLGAFYLGVLMFLGMGVFDTFPQEWIGVMPFNNWKGLALFGMIIFGVGNVFVSTYGFKKKDKKVFIMTIIMGALFFFCSITPIILLGEWYLPTALFWVLSLIQILLVLYGLAAKKYN